MFVFSIDISKLKKKKNNQPSFAIMYFQTYFMLQQRPFSPEPVTWPSSTWLLYFLSNKNASCYFIFQWVSHYSSIFVLAQHKWNQLFVRRLREDAFSLKLHSNITAEIRYHLCMLHLLEMKCWKIKTTQRQIWKPNKTKFMDTYTEEFHKAARYQSSSGKTGKTGSNNGSQHLKLRKKGKGKKKRKNF